MMIDDRCYNSRTHITKLANTPFILAHKPRGWVVNLGYKMPYYTLEINGVNYIEMAKAPPRERAALARSAI